MSPALALSAMPASPLGPWILFTNVLLQRAGLPIPVTPVLLLAGALAARDPIKGGEFVLLAVLACAIADLCWFLAGARYGSRVMHLLCRLSISPDICIDLTQRRFDRFGRTALVIAKFVPGLATIAPPLSGAMGMSLPQFLALSALGTTLWAGTYIAIGALASSSVLGVLPWVAHRGVQAGLIAVLLLFLYVLVRYWRRHRLTALVRRSHILPEELHTLLGQSPAPLVLDVRSALSRQLDPRAIPGALHVPPDDIAGLLRALGSPPDVIVYCNCPNDAAAGYIARKLIDAGFDGVRTLQGGLDGWNAAGYPLSVIEADKTGTDRQLAPV